MTRGGQGGASVFERREGRAGYALVAPSAILLAAFYLYPLLLTIVYSFTDWNSSGTGDTAFVGLANFARLAQDGDFLRSLGNTGLYVVVVVPVSMAVGLCLAAMLSTPFRGRTVYRTLVFLPYIAPMVGSALVFTYLLSPLGGLVNAFLASWGVPPVAFLSVEPWAFVVVLVFSVWQLVGYTMIIYSAALANIPESYHEAATLDGAGPVRRFLSISLPLVRPTTGFLAVTGTIGALQVFTQVYVLTRGGPTGSSSTALYWIYDQGFNDFNGGVATAGAVVLLVIGVVFASVQLRLQSRRDPIELQ
ncbi:sugar ABC transporter permease [Microbacterium betulae]|uniref:Sugar ABC transporter permease n=1 Tax=Microbacterium betulae TaxID=2981139 RepID=A0AA97FGU0_9MICO|nr:sugar ABC transporter permease [Microbacterium sp. AB]WOF23186.1 sugar ABC transporter permease [Microbacterium sp. AB]